MKRLLIVHENYAVRSEVDSQFKKIGFDIMSLGHSANIENDIMEFSPDIVVAVLRSPRVDGLKIARLCKGKSILVYLVFSEGYDANPKDLVGTRVDGLLDEQFTSMDLLKLLAKRMDLDMVALSQKLNRTYDGDSEPQKNGVQSLKKGVAVKPGDSSEERVARYRQLLRKLPQPEQQVLNTNHVGDFQKAFGEKYPADELQARAQEKAEFMKALIEIVRQSQRLP